MGESSAKYSGVKWTLQLTNEQAAAAERARRLTGFNRQELLSKALTEYIARHRDEWLQTFMSQFEPTAGTTTKVNMKK